MPLIHTTNGFLTACREGDEARVRSYFSWSGVPAWAKVQDNEGNTALIAAARGGLDTVVDDIIKYGGIDINARNSNGETALLEAVEYNQNDTVRVLLAAGADPNIANKQGRFPLDVAAVISDGQLVKLLLEANADPNTPGKPLIAALGYNCPGPALQLIAKGAKPDDHLDDYRTPLHCAAASNALDVMKALLDKGVDINARTSTGATPLLWAAENNCVMAIEFLIAHGASTTIENTDGRTPLMRAKERQFEQATRVLQQAETASKPVSTAVVSAAPAPANDESETWVLMAPNKAAHVGSYPMINRKITEVFNFASRERLIITENLKTGAESVTPAEKFENLPEDAVRTATEALTRLNGAADAPKKSFNL